MRSLARLAQRNYDLVILGGGITGACVARDAALRGLRVALVEKRDFCSATSAASSKLIHGGLRYLKNFELGLVRESLRERRLWELHAPHLVYPLPMLLPVYAGAAGSSLAELRVGLTLYDLLSWDRNRLPDPDQRLPAHRTLKPAEVLAAEPSLRAEGLKGGAVLHDCQMFSPERLELECLLSAAAAGAELVNYAEAVGFVREGARVVGAKIEGRLPGDGSVELRAPVVVNATGPWADLMLETLGSEPLTQLVRSKGIHIITRKLTREYALMMAAGTGHFFVLPWRDHALIGTTDEVYAGHPDAFRVTEADIAGLLATVNRFYPAAELRREDVLHSYGGLRPLVDDGPQSGSYQKSRRAEVCDHGKTDGVPGLVSAIGGKWTTSRALAEKVVDVALRLLGRPRAPCTTDRTPLPGGAIGNFRAFVAGLQARHPGLPGPLLHHLGRNYGARAGEVLALIQAEPTLGAPLRPGLPECGAEIVHASRAEWAIELGDAVLRRTGLGQLGDPGLRALEAAARLMGGARGWDRAEQVRQVDRVLDRYASAA
ncbi:glycerol-3-phosphate dehydrogenase/oxidase [Nannocystis bainbridge]|uniref:Glycerol-3-phosphate dehydrogenase/oxidase n=1 Tax=Nannocystis bainbridge TaxID=2995303 RepID=A0ABT5E127_9BACT|nr:glycerol-3-phosphate dehydrogenase/oxidase [Nannocystis bainbridge]MDC0718411.1 glycerol-3-phosphate dehydrogenase/oxidase [Nannocystis bainbridge]